MTAKKFPLKKSAQFEFHTFSLGEKTIMHALAEGRADKFGELKLGSHRISDELKNLGLSKSAWSGFSGEGAMTKLHHPDQQWDKDTLKPVS